MFDKTPGDTLEYHRSMLADEVRTRAFERAMQACVKPGDCVLDLGCGTGILSHFACRAGARRVYALEAGPVIELARLLCRDNGFADRIVFFNERSTRVRLPELADVVVSETLGNLGFDEGILEWVKDARRRFLKPGGIVIPQSISLFAAPVEMPAAFAGLNSWSQLPYELDFTAARSLACNDLVWTDVASEACLCEPALLGKVNLLRNDSDAFVGNAEVTASRTGMCHGIGGWFQAELTASISLSNEPRLSRSSWKQAFLPLVTPLPVQAGEILALQLSAHANGSLWRWQVRRGDAAGQRDGAGAVQSTLAGQFLSMAQLRKGAGHFMPRLGNMGQAQCFILESMDGSRDLDAIAAAALSRFPEAFTDVQDAEDVVRHLCRKFAL